MSAARLRPLVQIQIDSVESVTFHETVSPDYQWRGGREAQEPLSLHEIASFLTSFPRTTHLTFESHTILDDGDTDEDFDSINRIRTLEVQGDFGNNSSLKKFLYFKEITCLKVGNPKANDLGWGALPWYSSHKNASLATTLFQYLRVTGEQNWSYWTQLQEIVLHNLYLHSLSKSTSNDWFIDELRGMISLRHERSGKSPAEKACLLTLRDCTVQYTYRTACDYRWKISDWVKLDWPAVQWLFDDEPVSNPMSYEEIPDWNLWLDRHQLWLDRRQQERQEESERKLEQFYLGVRETCKDDHAGDVKEVKELPSALESERWI